MSRITAFIAFVIGLVVLALGLTHRIDSAPTNVPAKVPTPTASGPVTKAALVYDRLDHPGRTVVRLRSSGKVVATLTDGARTAALSGPARTFADPKFTKATVRSTTWVRLLPKAWTRGSETQPWFRTWFEKQSASTAPDVLAVAAQYLDGRPDVRDAKGIRFRGDASFGPLTSPSTDTREEASDFYDYLGVDWTFPDGVAKAETKRYGAVDCSGFVRLVYGYRMGLPLLNVNERGPGLPRRAFALADYAAGSVIVTNTHRRAGGYDRLQPGDLVFFDINGSTQIDHTGIYLGRDSSGHHRFISSRMRANGPTLGDFGGTSLLDDGGFYSQAFRTAKRL
jgi:cell wall-associated NlpC family hydrolase